MEAGGRRRERRGQTAMLALGVREGDGEERHRGESEAARVGGGGGGAERGPLGARRGWGRGRRSRPSEPSLRPRPLRRGTHPRSGSRCSPWLGASGAGSSPTRGGRGRSTGSRAAAPASLQRRGCLRSAPLPPPLSIPPRARRRRHRRHRRRLAPPPGLRSRPGRGRPGDWLRRAPPPGPNTPPRSARTSSRQPFPGSTRGSSGVRAGLTPRGAVESRRIPAWGPKNRVTGTALRL